jgi:hypothetical protein
VGTGLPAKNDDAQYLKNCADPFAGKPAPTVFFGAAQINRTMVPLLLAN